LPRDAKATRDELNSSLKTNCGKLLSVTSIRSNLFNTRFSTRGDAMRATTFGVFVMSLCVVCTTTLHAELPPGAYEELLKEATEVLDVRITKVMDASATPTDQPQLICDATVLAVKRSKSGIKQGETIQFNSYYVTDAARQRGWAGPKIPPRLSVGQVWRISLKAGEDGKPFELAAYGRSFQPLDSQDTPNTSPERLGVMAVPAGGGGLQITGVSRRSLADKLGLRSGDRVLEINGMPTSASADVGPAIAQNPERLESKFVRDGETIELTLKR
jgi:hypothetical protein